MDPIFLGYLASFVVLLVLWHLWRDK